jgi:hypothetical protein
MGRFRDFVARKLSGHEGPGRVDQRHTAACDYRRPGVGIRDR